MATIPTGILTNLLSEFLIVVFGVLFANFIKNRIDAYRFGRWTVTVYDAGGEAHERPISPKKAQQILAVPEDKSVYLKGVASVYGRLNCDLITEGAKLGMLQENHNARQFVIDMRLNPKPTDTPATAAPSAPAAADVL